MNSFEAMGQGMLDAAEGQRLLSAAFARWVGQKTMRLLDALARHLPEGKATPW